MLVRCTTARVMTRLILALMLFLTTGGIAWAQDASPVATPVLPEAPLDLPAMVLNPADLNTPGFGAGASGFADSTDQAATIAPALRVPVEPVAQALDDVGFVRRYDLALELPFAAVPATPSASATPLASAVDPGQVSQRITTAITEYQTAEDAAAGFNLLERELEAKLPTTDISVESLLGDDTDLTLAIGVTPDTGAPVQSLNLTMRSGNLVADVVVDDYSGQEIDQAMVEALGRRLLERIATVRAQGGPDLDSRTLRVEGPVSRAAYLALNGRPIPGFASTLEDNAQAAADLQAAQISAIYEQEQYLGQDPFLTARLYQFASPEAASAWLATLPGPMLTYPGSTYTNVEAVETDAPIGAASRAFAFTNQLDAATAVGGYVVFTLAGDLVARIEIDSVPDAPLSAVLTLAEAQAACLAAGDCSEAVAIPGELLAPPASSATPVATPVALIDPGLTGSGAFSAADGSWQVTWDEGIWTPMSVLRDDAEILLLSLVSESSAQLQVGTRGGYARFAGDAAACVQSITEAAAGVPEIHDFAPLRDATGTPVAERGDERATSAFRYMETLNDGSEQTFVAYATCITVVPGETVVAALYTVAQDRFEETRPLAEAVIENLTITPNAQE